MGLVALLLGPASGWLQLAAGLAIALIGVRTLLSARPAVQAPAVGAGASGPRAGQLARDYTSVLAITLANPPTILTFAALTAVLEPEGRERPDVIAQVVAGVFLGSCAWWTVLTGAVALVGRRLGPPVLRAVTRASGAVLLALGLIAVVTAVRPR